VQTIFLDTETTGRRGVYAGGIHEIVELAILDNRGKPVLNQLVRPAHRKSWLDAERIHGISPVMVAEAPSLETLLPQLEELVRGYRVVIYNSAFCLQFLPKDLFLESWVECAMLRFAASRGRWNLLESNQLWHELRAAARETGFNDDVEHRALSDAMACRHVWRHIFKG
jgi:DNA polymerase III epsilon subunit-like protein